MQCGSRPIRSGHESSTSGSRFTRRRQVGGPGGDTELSMDVEESSPDGVIQDPFHPMFRDEAPAAVDGSSVATADVRSTTLTATPSRGAVRRAKRAERTVTAGRI